jgi:leucine dehydrogenase
MSVFSNPAYDQHELLSFHGDKASGLQAIIAVHSSKLGPGVGGCRMYPYLCEADAITDVLRLSRGMTYKSALAGLPFGGGKSVIIGDPHSQKNPALMAEMGRFVDSLGGAYVAAEDSGTGVADIRTMSQHTRYVSGLTNNQYGGDPSPSTALGVYLAIKTAAKHRLDVDSLNGLSVAIQGLGHVGYYLAKHLKENGAVVYGADVNRNNLNRAVRELDITPVAAEDVLAMEVDILAPCAMGAVFNERTISQVRAGIVAGAANNQLATMSDGANLEGRGILYCPDFLINAGGIIDVYHQRIGSSEAVTHEHISKIAPTLAEVLHRADLNRGQTQLIAEELAQEYITQVCDQQMTLARAS